MAYALWSRARLRPRCRAPVNWWSRGELRAKFLCFSFLRREALWPGSAALLLLQRRIPAAVAATTSLQISSVLPLVWAGLGPTPAQPEPVIRATSPERAFATIKGRRGPSINARVHSGILSLELCVRLLRCCVSALISAVCSTTLSCTADPVAGADLLRCSHLQGEHSRS